MFADYVLSDAEGSKIHNGAVVTLLLIHPQIALVLTPSILFTATYDDQFRMTLDGDFGKKWNGETLWERVGIVRVSDTLLDLYQVDWMSSATLSTFSIV